MLKSITYKTKIFDLRTFCEPRKFFTDIRKEHAIKNGVEFEAVQLNFTFIPKEDCYGMCNLKIEAARINSNMLD